MKAYSIWRRRTYPFASIGRDVSLHFSSKISRERAPRIWIGNSVTVGAQAWLNVATNDPVADFTGEPTIVIEDSCIIAVGSILSAKNKIHLERNVNVAQQVLIMDHNHAYENIDLPIVEQGITEGGKIRIGEGSWIGHGAAIVCSRGDLNIGRHCVISANSVVTRSIPDYCVVFGVPATVIRQYDPNKRSWRMGPVRASNVGEQPNAAKAEVVNRESEFVEKS
jgi:acetyltransferase-like isoleucine patch superfamily enzyme